jgi:NADPH:quinone reductase
MRAIQVRSYGGPEVLEPAILADPLPHEGELLVSVTGAGVNFADTHQVENTYLTGTDLPFVPGSEVVGYVENAHGADRRMCGFVSRGGGYAERALIRPALSFAVPDGVSDGQALALLVQGLTAHHLVSTTGRVRYGDTVVVHAAAGGVGNLAVQLAKQAGAGRVIATASSQDKLDIALERGADVGVLGDPDMSAHDITQRLVSANGGRKVDVVLEMVGGAVFDGSLAALAPFGRLVTYGMAGRQPASDIHPGSLMVGSHTVTGFWLVDCMRPETVREMVAEPLAALVQQVAAGTLRPVVGATYPLSHARQAHTDLRARRTTGKVVLDPRLDEAHA